MHRAGTHDPARRAASPDSSRKLNGIRHDASHSFGPPARTTELRKGFGYRSARSSAWSGGALRTVRSATPSYLLVKDGAEDPLVLFELVCVFEAVPAVG